MNCKVISGYHKCFIKKISGHTYSEKEWPDRIRLSHIISGMVIKGWVMSYDVTFGQVMPGMVI